MTNRRLARGLGEAELRGAAKKRTGRWLADRRGG